MHISKKGPRLGEVKSHKKGGETMKKVMLFLLMSMLVANFAIAYAETIPGTFDVQAGIAVSGDPVNVVITPQDRLAGFKDFIINMNLAGSTTAGFTITLQAGSFVDGNGNEIRAEFISCDQAGGTQAAIDTPITIVDNSSAGTVSQNLPLNCRIDLSDARYGHFSYNGGMPGVYSGTYTVTATLK
jgi:hypothetical protein